MKFNEFRNIIQQNYFTVFNDGECEVQSFDQLGAGVVISIYANKEINVTRLNDLMHVSLFIELPRDFNFKEDELPDDLVMEVWQKSYLTRPEDEYHVYSSKTVPFRKTKGNVEKIVNKIENYYSTLYKMLEEDFVNNNFTDNYKPVVSKMLGIE